MAIVTEISWDDMVDGNFPESPTTDEQHLETFQQAVVAAAGTMDKPPFNTPQDKLQKAMDLVLTGKIQAHQNGLCIVQGSAKPYTIDGACPCPQGHSSKSKWCKHMVAVELWKRTRQRFYGATTNGNGNDPQPDDTPEDPEPMIGADDFPDFGQDDDQGDKELVNARPQTWVDCARQHPVLVAEPEPLVNHWTDVLAPICHTIKYVVDGIEHVTVIRGDDMQEVMTQVKELTALVKKGREHETVSTEDVPYCDKHKVHFERHSNAKGSWWSHKTVDGWCKHRG